MKQVFGVKGIAIALLLSATTPSLGSAQAEGQQTPANAKRFISLTLIGTRIWTNARDDTTVRGEIIVERNNDTSDACKIESTGLVTLNFLDKTGPHVIGQKTVVIDFSKVKEVIKNNDSVALIYSGYISPTDRVLGIDLPSSDLVDRMVYAVTFLKSRCNPADATGF